MQSRANKSIPGASFEFLTEELPTESAALKPLLSICSQSEFRFRSIPQYTLHMFRSSHSAIDARVVFATMPLHLVSHYTGPHGGLWEVHWFPRNQTANDYAKEQTRKAQGKPIATTPVRKRPAGNAKEHANAKARSTMKGKYYANSQSGLTGKKAKVH